MEARFVIQILLFVFSSKACTEIRVDAEDSSVVVAHSMELGVNTDAHIIVEPMGYAHTADKHVNCSEDTVMTWSNRWKTFYIDFLNINKAAVDGLNSEGLHISGLAFPDYAVYEEISADTSAYKCSRALSHMEFPLWILGNFGTTQALRDALALDSFPTVWEITSVWDGDEIVVPAHFSVIDRSGDSIIIEYTESGRKVHENTVGVMTNSPPYDYQMTNLKNYVQLSKYSHGPLHLGKTEFNHTGQGSGLLGIPGDYTPPSRLVRAAVIKSFSTPAKNADEAVLLAFHTMNNVDMPKGAATMAQGKEYADYTSYLTVKDLSNNIIYLRLYDDLSIRTIHLNQFPPEFKRKVMKLDDAPGGEYYDMTNDFQKPLKKTYCEE